MKPIILAFALPLLACAAARGDAPAALRTATFAVS